MIFAREDLEVMLKNYFFSENDSILLADAIKNQNDMIVEVISKFLMEYSNKLENEIPKFIILLQLLYPDKANLDHAELIKYHLTITSTFESVKILANDEYLSNSLKNLYMFTLIEKIRFAKLQKESLRDTSSYNRHIAKALMAMRTSLIVLFELKSDYQELESVLEKYYEFNRYVNTPECWTEFYTLKKYGTFQSFIDKKREELLKFYKDGNLQYEAVKDIIND